MRQVIRVQPIHRRVATRARSINLPLRLSRRSLCQFWWRRSFRELAEQAMQQNGKKTKLLDKLKRLKNNETLQEILIISILFILFSTGFYKDNLSKIPFVTNSNNCLLVSQQANL